MQLLHVMQLLHYYANYVHTHNDHNYIDYAYNVNYAVETCVGSGNQPGSPSIKWIFMFIMPIIKGNYVIHVICVICIIRLNPCAMGSARISGPWPSQIGDTPPHPPPPQLTGTGTTHSKTVSSHRVGTWPVAQTQAVTTSGTGHPDHLGHVPGPGLMDLIFIWEASSHLTSHCFVLLLLIWRWHVLLDSLWPALQNQRCNSRISSSEQFRSSI